MKFRPFALLACALVVGLTACREDPTEANVGVAEAIITTRSETTVAKGGTVSVQAYVVDKNLQRIPGPLTATPAGAGVTIDSVTYVPELTHTLIFVRAGQAAGSTNITISGHGLTKDVKVTVK